MIAIKLLNGNLIITLEGDAPKSPIKSSGGLYFYNSMELLCMSVGSCGGKEIVRYCVQNKIDVEQFESIGIDMVDGIIKYYIYHPRGLEDKHIEQLMNLVKTCEVAKLLNNDIDVIMRPNETDPEPRKPARGCCGG